MNALFRDRVRIAVSLSTLSLVILGSVLVAQLSSRSSANAISPCSFNVMLWYPVSGSRQLTGDVCLQFGPGSLDAQVEAQDTITGGAVSEAWTYISGMDRCLSTDPWVGFASGDATGFGVSFQSSGVYGGTYQNCTQGHSYREYGDFEVIVNGGTTWEGYAGHRDQ